MSTAVHLRVDNGSAIRLAKNPIAHGRTKHIEIRHHYVRDQVEKKKIDLKHCRTEMQVADILTKEIRGERFKMLRDLVGIVNVEKPELRGCVKCGSFVS